MCISILFSLILFYLVQQYKHTSGTKEWTCETKEQKQLQQMKYADPNNIFIFNIGFVLKILS